MRGRLREAQAHCREAGRGAAEAEKGAKEAERRAAIAEKRLAAAQAALRERRELLDRTAALHAAGLDGGALARLGEALGAAAQAEGKPAAEVVPAFLAAAADWRRLAELRAQVQGQAAEAEEQARARMAEAKVTERAVKAARWLLRERITTHTVEAWQTVAAKLGLADGLARALEEHGSMDATRQALAASIGKLRADHAKLTGGVAALRQEKDGLAAAVAAVRDAGLTEVREVADAAVAEVQRAAAQFGRISEQAAELGPHLRMARALGATHPSVWRTVAPGTSAALLGHLLRWAEVHAVATVEVPRPAAVQGRLEEQPRSPTRRGPCA